MLAFLLLFVTLGRLYRDMIKQPETRALLVLAVVVLAIGGFFATLGRLIDPQRLLSLRGVRPELSKEIEALAKERERLAQLIHREEAADAAAPDAEQDER